MNTNPNIKIYDISFKQIFYKHFIFPAGEISVKLDLPKENQMYFAIEANIHNSNDLITLGLLVNAIRNYNHCAVIGLIMPYVPYGRQDRICDTGEAFSLKFLADYINSLNFKDVIITDPHSEVTPALIDRVKIQTQLDVIKDFIEFNHFVNTNNAIFVSPDAGANKKTANVAAYYNHPEFIRADKLRDLTNGKIKETIVYCDDLTGKDVIIIDDICEFGGTFIALAQALKPKNPKSINLYVTHGIFSHEKSVNNLLDNGIDKIFTTDSYRDQPMGYYPLDRVIIHKL